MGLQDIKLGKRLFEKQNKGEKEEELGSEVVPVEEPKADCASLVSPTRDAVQITW